jgi:hypothetical protein
MASTQDSSSVVQTTESDAQSDSGLSAPNNSNSQRDEESNNEDDGANKLTLKWIYDFFKKDWKTYYRTLELNEKLYFHFKGRRETFTLQGSAK